MRKRVRMTAVWALLMAFCVACANKDGGRQWLCTAAVAPNSGMVTCEGTVRSSSGEFCIRNQSGVGVTVCLLDAEGAPAFTMAVPAGGVFQQYQVPRDTPYTVSLSASVTVKRDITVVVSDQPLSEPYPAS